MTRPDDKPRPVPAKKPGAQRPDGKTGPSMKEKILARKRAEAEAAAGGKAQAAPSAARSAQTRPGAVRKPTGRPAPVRPPASDRSKAALEKAHAEVEAERKKNIERATRASGAAGGGARTSRSTARRAGAGAGRRGRGGDGDGNDDGGDGRRGRRPAKKKSPAPMIGLAVLIAAGAFGAWKLMGDDDEASAAESGENAVAAAGVDPTALADPAATVPEEGGADELETAVETPPDEVADDEAETESDKKPSEKTDADYDPMEVSWDELEKFGPPEGTSDEEWQEIKRLVVTFTDPDAGAAGNRAGNKLQEEYGKKAFPALVNAMLDLDLTTDEGHRNGNVVQKRLQFIANGRNAGWKYEREEWPNRTAWFNRKVVALLHKVWERAKDDDAYWTFYAKLEGAEGEEGAETEKKDEATEDALDDLDDL